jgi:hypothetical protein
VPHQIVAISEAALLFNPEAALLFNPEAAFLFNPEAALLFNPEARKKSITQRPSYTNKLHLR